MTAGPNPTSGKDSEPAKKLGSVFLWIALFLTIPVGRRAGAEGADTGHHLWKRFNVRR